MKIRIGKLRQIIRETLEEKDLDEMALAGVYPAEHDRHPGMGFLSKAERKKNYDALSRYHAGDLYKEKAEFAFRFFSIPVYILPLETANEMSGKRVFFYPIDQGLELLTKVAKIKKKKGAEGWFDIADIEEKLKGGATLIVSLCSEIRPNQVPTPWMLFHAMFDGARPNVKFEAQYKKLQELIDELFDLAGTEIYSYFTMKSARDNNIDDRGNLVAEIMTQEIVDSRGLNVKFSENNEEINSKLRGIVETVKSWNLRELMEKSMRGKIVFAHVCNVIT